MEGLMPVFKNRPFQQIEMVAQRLVSLFDREVALKKLPIPLYPTPWVVGSYHQAGAPIGGVCVLELSAVFSFGAALSMQSPREVQRSLMANRLPVSLEAHLRGLLDACSALFEPDPTLQVRFQGPPLVVSQQLPAEVAALLRNPKVRADYQVSILNYPPGTVRFLAPVLDVH